MSALADRCDEAMADAVLADLLDRGGIQQMLEEIKYGDPETWRDIRGAIGAAARLALLSELDAAGWKIAPKVATERMMESGESTFVSSYRGAPIPTPENVYIAMLAAAPQPFKEQGK
jgi:hypothetical protein